MKTLLTFCLFTMVAAAQTILAPKVDKNVFDQTITFSFTPDPHFTVKTDANGNQDCFWSVGGMKKGEQRVPNAQVHRGCDSLTYTFAEGKYVVHLFVNGYDDAKPTQLEQRSDYYRVIVQPSLVVKKFDGAPEAPTN